MSGHEALAVLERMLNELKDALCIHQDEFGTHYADQEAVWELEGVVDTVRALVHGEDEA